METTAAAQARNRAIRAALAQRQPVALRHGYSLEYHPVTKVRGWPAPNGRPFQLRTSDGAFLAGYATLEALERAFDARAGL